MNTQLQQNGSMPQVWNPGEKVEVCREIVLQIPDTEHGRRNPRMIVENSIPSRMEDARTYLKALVPGGNVEHLGRQEMLGICRISRYGGSNTSSLFFQAVHACFAEHYALALRPEVLMQLVLSQVAETVKQNPDRYRDLFTTNQDKENIEIRRGGLVRGNPSSPWDEAISMFSPALRENVPSSIMDDVLISFSTDTVEAQLARLITFMDAASPFYDYRVNTMCGIPRVRMLGTTEDWRRLATSVANLSRMFGDTLGKYFRYLSPVTDKLAAQACAEPQDDEFWKSIYKYRSMSGGATANGWITAFVNYVMNDRNNGSIVEKHESAYNWDFESDPDAWGIPGISANSVPSLVSSVPFVWNCLGTVIKMKFLGGVLGIDNVDGCVTPALSYAVVQAPPAN